MTESPAWRTSTPHALSLAFVLHDPLGGIRGRNQTQDTAADLHSTETGMPTGSNRFNIASGGRPFPRGTTGALGRYRLSNTVNKQSCTTASPCWWARKTNKAYPSPTRAIFRRSFACERFDALNRVSAAVDATTTEVDDAGTRSIMRIQVVRQVNQKKIDLVLTRN
jgi:hypothetical protein